MIVVLALSITGPDTSGATPASPWQRLTNQLPFSVRAMLLLTDGTVMVQRNNPSNGGNSGNPDWWRLTPDINGSYVNGTWSQIASLPAGYAPVSFASAVLPDGRVIVEGGEYDVSGTIVETDQGAIYDPVANTWTSVQPPPGSLGSHIGDAPSIVLANGTFFLGPCCSPGIGTAPSGALLDAATLTWTVTGTGKSNYNGEEGWTLLPDGSVLTVDAFYPPGTCGTNSERYLPETGQWISAGSTVVQLADCAGPNPTYEIGPQVLRPDGTVIVFGGTTSGGPAHTAIYNSNTGVWAAGPDIPTINGQSYTLPDAPAALLPSGNVLFVAYPPRAGNLAHFFVVEGASIIQVANPATLLGWMLVLPTGQILYNGGEVYNDSGMPDPAWAPVITSVPATLNPGATYRLSGQQLNGL